MKIEAQDGSVKREEVCPSKKGKLDLDSVRSEIEQATEQASGQKTGPEYWRSLEELAGSPDFQDALHREFPKGASEWVHSVSRRGFLEVMGASLGLAGMKRGVRGPLHAHVPPQLRPGGGIPRFHLSYAT